MGEFRGPIQKRTQNQRKRLHGIQIEETSHRAVRPQIQNSHNPPVGLVTQQTDPPVTSRKTYEYDPHLDPQLVWAGKKEHTSFEVPTVSLHVHERIDPRTIPSQCLSLTILADLAALTPTLFDEVGG